MHQDQVVHACVWRAEVGRVDEELCVEGHGWGAGVAEITGIFERVGVWCVCGGGCGTRRRVFCRNVFVFDQPPCHVVVFESIFAKFFKCFLCRYTTDGRIRQMYILMMVYVLCWC